MTVQYSLYCMDCTLGYHNLKEQREGPIIMDDPVTNVTWFCAVSIIPFNFTRYKSVQFKCQSEVQISVCGFHADLDLISRWSKTTHSRIKINTVVHLGLIDKCLLPNIYIFNLRDRFSQLVTNFRTWWSRYIGSTLMGHQWWPILLELEKFRQIFQKINPPGTPSPGYA